MKNNYNYKGFIWVFPIEDDAEKEVECFIRTINERKMDGLNLNIHNFRQDSAGYYELSFSGSGKAFLSESLKDFNQVFLTPDADAVSLKQSLQHFQMLHFGYCDYNLGERLLRKENYVFFLKDGLVESIEEMGCVGLPCDASNLMDCGVFDEVYDCKPSSLLAIDPQKIGIKYACILRMFRYNSKKMDDLSSYLYQKHEDKFYFTFEDFWAENGKLIHEWIAKNCIIDATLGENISKINNTILLLDDKKQRYKKKNEYTVKCILDFFDIADQAMAGPGMEDVIDLLENMENKPLCVEMFLEANGPSF